MRLSALAPGKLNLCLWLGGLREDGRHELVTVFQSVSLADRLELATLSAGCADEVVCEAVTGENLAARALADLRRRGWDAPPVRVEIVKCVPVAAGMGGGSADAAATLRLAHEVAAIDPAVMLEVAAGLGADVPAQLAPGIALGTGAGEVIEPLERLAEHAYVIVVGAEPLLTPAVFAEADRLGLPRPPGWLASQLDAVRGAFAAGVRPPDDALVNDLEPAATSLQPSIAATLARVRAAGADQALMCGSGPTVAGVFWGAEAAARAGNASSQLGPPALVATPVGPDAGAVASSPG